MTELDLIKFQWYSGNISHATPLGTITLKEFIYRHQSPTTKILEVFDEIETAAADGNKKLKSELKQNNLFYFTPGAIFNGRRRYANIVQFTGLAQIDIDGLEHDEALELKEYLFENFPQIYLAYVSPSRKGVKALIRIPVVKSIEEFKEYYAGIEKEFEWIAGFDSAPKNLALPLFLSYDTDLLYRESATVWKTKGELLDLDKTKNLKPTPQHNDIYGDETVYKSNAYYRKISLNIFESKINQITGNGHPQLRSACLVLGSRIGAGYLSQADAEQYAEYCIRNNSYLKKGTNGYISTMRWCIKKSIMNPKYYS